MTEPPAWKITVGNGPLVAAAIHNGHSLRSEVERCMLLSAPDRLREEDPFTGLWASVAPTSIVGLRSRFEFDLNRAPDKAIYATPEDCWGLKTWNCEPPESLLSASRALYDKFYREVHATVEGLLAEHPRLVVFDLHTYNHRRDGATGPAADPDGNPEVNLGTGSLDRTLWGSVADAWMESLRSYDYFGRSLDVRENVRFQGGHFGRWLHAQFPGRVCALSIEFKKFFMDEWTGEAEMTQVDRIRQALAATVPVVTQALAKLDE